MPRQQPSCLNYARFHSRLFTRAEGILPIVNSYRTRPFSHAATRAPPKKTPPSSPSLAECELTHYCPVLRESLQAWRQTAAAAAGWPAYCIFSNAVLGAICAARPSTKAELLAVKGFGPVLFKKCGTAVLTIVGAAGPRKRPRSPAVAAGGSPGMLAVV